MPYPYCQHDSTPIYHGLGRWKCPDCERTFGEEEFTTKVLIIKDREIDRLNARVRELEDSQKRHLRLLWDWSQFCENEFGHDPRNQPGVMVDTKKALANSEKE